MTDRGGTHGPEDQFSDPLFDIPGDKIFVNKDMLRVGWVPENEDMIIGRDEEMRQLATYINPILSGQEPDHVVVYGKTGTGKSLITRHVVQRACSATAETIGHAYIDCKQYKTETQVFAELGRIFNDPEATGQTVPETGLSTARYKSRLYDALEASFDGALIILDEMDKLRDDDTVLELSRAVEDRKTDVPIGVIVISNRIGYIENFQARVESSFDPRDIQPAPYDAAVLQQIMESRRGAFVDGVLTDDVIPKAAAVAGAEHGDARKAIRILRHAGEAAANEGTDRVTADHIDVARHEAEKNRFGETIQNATAQEKAVLLALAELTLNNEKDQFKQSELYEQYQTINEAIEMNTLSQRRVRDLANDYALLDVLEVDKRNFGQTGGIHRVSQLLLDAEIVRDVIMADDIFELWAGRDEDRLYQTKLDS
jgi:cell division control protein 6